ncbi:MobA-like NTP transferase domain-containing protein [Novosphingobium sp. CF614]|uniref:NTP transferase domain-containing protein n=1 Tax=Novosphingobium sp. CF614 TaxID=1884364 RepID=UPI0008F13A76|nr:NTP transferase domain-containing protein [Novosphingobium sp. CF614]SFF89906.1 MobA-like NTP transferase domain-containing protein [Novosphingobium sp. CF614]
MPSPRPLRVIVLAGQCRSVADPFAERFGMRHKYLVPLHGRPLVAHLLRMLAAHDRVASLVICVEREAFDAIYDLMAGMPGHRTVRLLEARGNVTDSVLAAAEGWQGPLIVTTADHALLRPEAIDAVADALEGADAAVAVARREDVIAADPETRRRFHQFRDDAYAGCHLYGLNLYGLTGPQALRAAGLFRDGGHSARNAVRVVRAFGVVNLLLLRFRLVSLATGLGRISRRIGLRIAPVVLPDGTQAIAVDNDRAYAVAAGLMAPAEEPRSEPLPHAIGTPRVLAPIVPKVARTSG